MSLGGEIIVNYYVTRIYETVTGLLSRSRHAASSVEHNGKSRLHLVLESSKPYNNDPATVVRVWMTKVRIARRVAGTTTETNRATAEASDPAACSDKKRGGGGGKHLCFFRQPAKSTPECDRRPRK